MIEKVHSACKRLVLLLFLLLFGVQPLIVRAQQITGAIMRYTPYSKGDQPIVQVTFSDGHSANFLLDTGCTWSLVTGELARTLGLTPRNSVDNTNKNVLLAGKQLQSVVITGAKLGAMTLPVQFRITERAKLSHILPGSKIDGIIGMNFLTGKSLFIDPENRQITLWPGSLPQSQRENLPLYNAYVCQTRVGVDQLLYLSTHLNDSLQADLALDTGSGGIAIPVDTGKHLKSAVVEKKTKEETVRTFFGDRKTHDIILDKLSLDDVSGSAPYTLIKPTVYHFEENIANFAAGTIGMGVFSQCYTLIDFAERKVYLKPLMDRKSDVGLGLIVQETPPNGLIVTGTDPGSPAREAGLQSGDEVLKIDGKALPANEEALENKLRQKMRQPEGAKVMLTVRRKGEASLLDVTLTFRKLNK